MRTLGPIVQTFMLTMITNGEADLAIGVTIRTQFIGGHNVGCCTLA